MSESVHGIPDYGSKVDFVICGYTSKLQVFDVGVNKLFQDYMKRHYDYYRVENESSVRMKRMDISK